MEFVIVILGAAVARDGGPSDPMRRRVQGALDAAASLTDPVFIPSGGVGRYGPSEASVMAALLQTAGITGDRIICENASASTVASVVHCTRLIQERFCDPSVLVCTDAYHRLRARWLFRLAGLRVKTPPVPGGFSARYLRRWVYYVFREIVAIPVDTILMCVHGLSGAMLKH
jgi:uncharacterized SAM-binding protein YcdF (DUF218 family)